MIPTLILAGLLAGVFVQRISVLVMVLVVASGLWLIVVAPADVSDIFGVLGMAVANLAVGAAVGWGVHAVVKAGRPA